MTDKSNFDKKLLQLKSISDGYEYCLNKDHRINPHEINRFMKLTIELLEDLKRYKNIDTI